MHNHGAALPSDLIKQKIACKHVCLHAPGLDLGKQQESKWVDIYCAG